MLDYEGIIERLKELGRRFEEYYNRGEWHLADQQYQKYCIVTSLLEMTGKELQPIRDANLFQLYKTDKALERAGLRAVHLNPFGIRKRA